MSTREPRGPLVQVSSYRDDRGRNRRRVLVDGVDWSEHVSTVVVEDHGDGGTVVTRAIRTDRVEVAPRTMLVRNTGYRGSCVHGCDAEFESRGTYDEAEGDATGHKCEPQAVAAGPEL